MTRKCIARDCRREAIDERHSHCATCLDALYRRIFRDGHGTIHIRRQVTYPITPVGAA